MHRWPVATPNKVFFRRRYLIGILLGFALLIAISIFMAAPKPVPPLPFDTNGFVASSPPSPNPFALPPNPSIGQRLRYLDFKLMSAFRRNSTTWYFPASATTFCSVQGMLDQCMAVTGTRYLMSTGVAAGVVQFGHTNTLDGPRWVAAFENALQTNSVQYNPQFSGMNWEHLVLLRFPAQKVVVVLPTDAAEEFQRTNGIHVTGGATKN